MSLSVRLLKLATKIALDKVIGTNRVDEATVILQDWWSAGNEISRDQELADAKQAIAESSHLEKIIAEIITETGNTISPRQIETITLSLASGFKALPEHLGNNPLNVQTITAELLPGHSKTFMVWLDNPVFHGPQRYVHFNWDGESWRVRDFIGGKIFHPVGSKATDNGLIPVEVSITALEIWKSSKGQVQSLKKYGLGFPISNQEKWRQALTYLGSLPIQTVTTQLAIAPLNFSVLA